MVKSLRKLFQNEDEYSVYFIALHTHSFNKTVARALSLSVFTSNFVFVIVATRTHTLLSECRSVAFAAFIILHFKAWNFVSHVLTHFLVAVLYTLVSSLLFGCASSLAFLDKWAHTMIKMWHIVAHSFILIPMFFFVVVVVSFFSLSVLYRQREHYKPNIPTSSCYFFPHPKKSNNLGISAFCFINFRIILVSLCARMCLFSISKR